ncbi:MAG: TonB-dependent receptor plug domain-containing protein [Bacteroidota bacterium]
MKTIFVIIFSFVMVQSDAQERIIHGIVTTFDSILVNGATIKVQSSKQTVLTDSLGNFSVGCDYKDKLKVSGSGFYSETVKVDKNTKLAAVNLKLKPGIKNKELALGLTRVSDHDKLNALASLDSNDIDFSKYRTMEEAIAGRIPGVRFVGGQIIIRGNASISGLTPALIVVDGVTTDARALSRMNPADVKSINVIKDGSSAMYGSKGANGVVIIETKTGRD